LQRSILTKLELRGLFEKSGFPTGQKRRFLIFATEPYAAARGGERLVIRAGEAERLSTRQTRGARLK
jgi:hypothetical protein